MSGNREKQFKNPHLTQCTDKQPGIGPAQLIIMPTSFTAGHQHKAMNNNREKESKVTHLPPPAVKQTIGRPVQLVLIPAPSIVDQQHASISRTKQCEKKILLLPQSVVMQPKAAYSQSAVIKQPQKEGGQTAHMSSELQVTELSHSSTSQAGEVSTHLSEKSLLSEAQQSESRNTLKDRRLREEFTSDCSVNHPGMIPPHLVVMTASSKEIDYRIKAFLARKRAELDVQNVEEFCLHIGMNPNVCARVDATVHQHRKRKKRKFEFTPQPEEKSEGTYFMSKDASHEQPSLSVTHPILEERVANAEKHLRLGKPVPKDIYSRLKRIEDRILQLEGFSPEYAYDAPVNLHPPRPLPVIKRRCTIDELDAKIAEFQKKFEKKSCTSSERETVK